MKIYLDRTNRNPPTQQRFSSDKEISEKTEKVAIDAIILYLKSIDNTARLKRSYSREESFENLDFITECYDYKTQVESPIKKMKISAEISNDCVLDSSSSLQSGKIELRRHFDTVLEAVKRDGLELQYASRRLQNNDTIVLHAVRQNGLALQYASQKQRNSGYLALKAVRQNGLVLEYLCYRLRDRFDIVAAAVRQNSLALSFASKRLQDDDEIIEFARLDRQICCSRTQHWLT